MCRDRYKSPECQAQLTEDNCTEIGLLRTALSHDANDNLARRRLLVAFAYHLEYAIHEVPSGVLWGNNVANIAQCAQLRTELAEFCEQYVKKGHFIFLEGHLQTRTWEDKEEVKHYMTEVIGERLTMLGGKKNGKSEEEPVAAVAEGEESIPF